MALKNALMKFQIIINKLSTLKFLKPNTPKIKIKYNMRLPSSNNADNTNN